MIYLQEKMPSCQYKLNQDGCLTSILSFTMIPPLQHFEDHKAPINSMKFPDEISRPGGGLPAPGVPSTPQGSKIFT